jgi:hypothetical protein
VDATTSSLTELDDLVDTWLTLPDIAERLRLPVTRVRQLLRDGQLVAVRRGESAALHVPAAFVGAEGPVKGLTGTLTLLRDAGYSDAEAVRWLFTPDESLPGRPVDALVENRGREVKRRAQALAL